MSGLSRWGQMSERKQFRAIKGTRDILPPDSARWNWFEHTAREVFESYNFSEIRTPILEEALLFARSVGEESDIVGKEMYVFSGKLESLRRAISESIGRLDNSSRVYTFVQFLAVLRRNLNEGLDTGQIPKNLSNLHKIGQLEARCREGENRLLNGDVEPSATWTQLFEDTISILDDFRPIEESEA